MVEQVELEVDSWYKRRQEEVGQEDSLPSARLNFQVEWARVCVTICRPDDLINDLLDDVLMCARAEVARLEAGLKSITEDPQGYVEWYVKINRGAIALSEDEKDSLLNQQTLLMSSEMEIVKGLIEKILEF